MRSRKFTCISTPNIQLRKDVPATRPHTPLYRGDSCAATQARLSEILYIGPCALYPLKMAVTPSCDVIEDLCEKKVDPDFEGS